MAQRTAQKYLEYGAFLFSLGMLLFLIIRTHVLYRYDWDYIRGPLAPRAYYQLGLLDERIPSDEYYPYTLIPTPTPVEMDLISEEIIKDSTVSVENVNNETP